MPDPSRPDLSRAAGLLLGALADRALGDPRRRHPVAGFGAVAALAERRWYRDTVAAGGWHVAALVLPVVGAAAVAERGLRRWPWPRAALTAGATWTVLGGRSLGREAAAVHTRLVAGDLPAARVRLTHLVGRDTARLDTGEVARAVVESVAENTSDAVVGPLVWGALFGVPGLLGYRAVNTLDAMVGHRSDRYLRFGRVAARLDDLVNLLPARLCVALTAAAAPVVGGRPAAAIAAARRDGGRHPSPNAGPVEAAAAGALGITLGGTNSYEGAAEDRGTLGDGPPPGPADIPRAVRLAATVGWLSAGVAAAVPTIKAVSASSAVSGRRGRRRAGR
ncbi:cobalamin biosynthesis protein [Nakamurella endophytica]|uniref:Cobalamin biosynthesis protein CobD n=1 Tax=Nakamurella endophytica TaxID=1748367 RepID=A0A917SKN4_9ACTN|nr:cobalamin biosynthesis protein [Nakamurella endophytica]GGL85121.1 cobalamin biosynthesis protein CobD [Nakamurella endophytica]